MQGSEIRALSSPLLVLRQWTALGTLSEEFRATHSLHKVLISSRLDLLVCIVGTSTTTCLEKPLAAALHADALLHAPSNLPSGQTTSSVPGPRLFLEQGSKAQAESDTHHSKPQQEDLFVSTS